MPDTSPLVIDPPILRRILERVPGFIIVFNLDLRIRYINRLAPGFRMEEVIGSSLDRFQPPVEAQRLRSIIAGIQQHGTDAQMEYVVEHPDGSPHWYVARMSALRDQQGTMIGFVQVSNDVTAHKRIEQELHKTQGALADAAQRADVAEMATGVLHNVGNVLNSVNVSVASLRQELSSTHIDMLGRTVKLCDEQGEKLPGFLARDPRGQRVLALLGRITQQIVDERKRLGAEVQRMIEHVQLIRSTVEVQQSVAKTGSLVEEAIPQDLIERTLSMFRLDLQRMRIDTKVDVALEVGLRLRLDKQMTLQILINLIRNAIDALSEVQEPRKLHVHIHAKGGYVSFEIEDNGCGIAPENLSHIFRHGFTTKQPGHGFGLHASAVAVKAMGGSLGVESAGPGHGARFMLLLPQSPPGSAGA